MVWNGSLYYKFYLYHIRQRKNSLNGQGKPIPKRQFLLFGVLEKTKMETNHTKEQLYLHQSI